MKKIIGIITIIAIFTVLIFSGKTYAASLDTIDVQTDKTTVAPGEQVSLTINFGQSLGAYTFDISYDNNLFEYVSADGGTANNTGDKVRVVFFDSTGGTNPRTNMSVKFKAKSDITTSNPTELTVTGNGLANADASVTFDDITTPIVKNVTVEPNYVDYTIKLEPAGPVVKEKENAMTLSFSSPMGRYYEHARLVAEATTPAGATVQLLATDSSNLEHDIIQSGWGDPQGYKIGGKDVSQVLQVRGVFSHVGTYTITLKLIDRDNGDSVISQKAVQFNVLEESQITPDNNTGTTEETKLNQTNKKTPTKLPKTGSNIYVPIGIILFALVGVYVYFNKNRS